MRTRTNAGTGRATRAVRLAAATAVALAGGAVALASGTAVASASGGAAALTLYSGQHEQTTQLLVRGFEKKTGITVKVRFDDEDLLADQITTEGSHSPADLFFTENSPPLQALAAKGLLSSVASSTLAHTKPRFDSPAGKWIGVSARVSVMIYNTKLLRPDELPTSAMELAQARWKGKVAIAPGETDFQPIVTSIARAHGTKAALRWLEALKANAGNHLYPDNETLTDKVNRGQAAIGIINQYYWYRERAAVGAANMHSAIATFAPHDVGYVVDVSGAAIVKSSPHQAEDQRFLAYLASAAGQRVIDHSQSWEYPIDSGVQRTGETPFDQLQPNAISVRQLGTGAGAVALLQEAQLL